MLSRALFVFVILVGDFLLKYVVRNVVFLILTHAAVLSVTQGLVEHESFLAVADVGHALRILIWHRRNIVIWLLQFVLKPSSVLVLELKLLLVSDVLAFVILFPVSPIAILAHNQESVNKKYEHDYEEDEPTLNKGWATGISTHFLASVIRCRVWRNVAFRVTISHLGISPFTIYCCGVIILLCQFLAVLVDWDGNWRLKKLLRRGSFIGLWLMATWRHFVGEKVIVT